MEHHALLTLAAIGLIGIACQWLAWRVRLPAILFLLLAGILAGPVTGWLNPDKLFGELLFPFVSLSVAVILFEGALTLRFDRLRGLGQVVRRMVIAGLVITWLVCAASAWLFMGYSVELALLFGALVVVTGPTVIAPMLRVVRPKPAVAEVLRWEGIVIDPFGALLAVLVFEFVVARGEGAAWSHTLTTFAGTLVVGTGIGAIAGWVLGSLLRRHAIPDYLQNVFTLALVGGAFAASDSVVPESGLLAVTVMGMVMANLPRVHVEDILDFKESLSVLLISTLFVVLAARIELEQLQALGWGAIGVLAIVQFVARPLQVAAATAGSSLDLRERALLAWIAPRGIIAAAISAIFAPRMEELGFEGADLLVPLVFAVIVGTVVLQSATSRPLAKRLGVAEPDPRGFLILGANPVARAIAKALHEAEVPVLLVDTNWENVRAARMEEIPTWFGNPMSDRAETEMSLAGLGGLLALTPNRELNLLANRNFLREFGQQRLFRLRARVKSRGTTTKVASEKAHVNEGLHGRVLFAEDAVFPALAARVRAKQAIRGTTLSDEFGWSDWRKQHADALPMFAISPSGKVEVFSVGDEGSESPEVGPGWKILAWMPIPSEPLPA